MQLGIWAHREGRFWSGWIPGAPTGTETALDYASGFFSLRDGDVVTLDGERWQRTPEGWELLPENESLRVRELTPEQAPPGARVCVTGVRREPGRHRPTSTHATRLLGRRGTVRHLFYAGSEHAELDVAWDEPAHWLMLAPLDMIQVEGGGPAARQQVAGPDAAGRSTAATSRRERAHARRA